MRKRIALFSPVTGDFREWHILTDLFKSTLEINYDITVFAKDGVAGSVAYHEFAWRNIKNPFDLVIYNFSRGDDSAYMAPFMLTKPGLLILRSVSFAESLWRMHTLDGTEQDFLNEMAYCYGRNGMLLGNLMWRGMWGEQLERKFPLLKLAAHSSIAVCGFDPWILDRTSAESVFGETKLLPAPFLYDTKGIKRETSSVLTFYTAEYPLLIEVMLKAAREVKNAGIGFTFTIVTDEKNIGKVESLIVNEGLESVAKALLPENGKMLDSLVTESAIFLFLEDPAAPVEFIPLISASSAGCACVLSDSLARINMPDSVYPKFRFSSNAEGLFVILKELLSDVGKTEGIGESAKKHFMNKSDFDAAAPQSEDLKFINPQFAQSLMDIVIFSIEAAPKYAYPLGYPEHLQNFKNRLLSSMKAKVSDFPPSGEIDEALDYIIGYGLKK